MIVATTMYMDGRRSTLRWLLEGTHNVSHYLGGLAWIGLVQVSLNQNDEVKKISASAAILVVLTSITGLCSTNFEHIPELAWMAGYPFALLVLSVLIFGGFKLSGCLRRESL